MNTNFYISKSLWCKKNSVNRLTRISGKIAGISISVSIMVMILAIFISDGFKMEIKEKAAGFSGELIINTPGFEMNSNQYPVEKDPKYLESIKDHQNVKHVQPFAYRSGLLKNGEIIQGVVLKGIDSSYDWSFFNSVLSEGRVIDFKDSLSSKEILMSTRLATMLGYKPGDKVEMYFVDKTIRVKLYKLVGLFDAQLEDVDKSLVICDLKEVQRLNYWDENQVSGIEIFLNDYKKIDETAVQIEDLIFKADNNESTVIVSKITDLFPHLFDWLRLLDFNVLVVLVLMLAVAGFNMVSGLLIMLFEKISTIGLFKSLGMRNSDIHKIFLYRAASIVVKGILSGTAIAFILAFVQWKFRLITLDPANYFVKFVPIDFNFYKVAILDLSSFIVIMLILLIPSVFISNVSPEKTLRVK